MLIGIFPFGIVIDGDALIVIAEDAPNHFHADNFRGSRPTLGLGFRLLGHSLAFLGRRGRLFLFFVLVPRLGCFFLAFLFFFVLVCLFLFVYFILIRLLAFRVL